MAIDQSKKKKTVFREWIIFAISMGAGAHVALGMILHAPERWDWNHTATHTILIGFAIYGVIQIIRSFRWIIKRKRPTEST